MRLQVEAAAAGGRVHVTLGNHEAMTCSATCATCEAGEYAAYAEEEDAAERAGTRPGSWHGRPVATEADFDRLFPPGYFVIASC